MIAILYPLKMDKNLSEAYSAIYESSLTSGSSGGNYHDVGGGDYRSTDQVVRMNNDPKGTKKYGTKMMKKVGNTMTDLKIPTVMKKNESLEPEMDIVEGDTKAMNDFLEKKAKKLEDEKKNQKPEYKNNPAFGDPSHHSNAKSKNEAYDNRYSDNTGKESKEKLKKLEKKRGMKLKGHPQFTRDDVGKFRQEWEALKLIETENHREKFDTWLEGIAEE